MPIGGECIRSAVARQLTNGDIKAFDLGARGIYGHAPTMAFQGLGEGIFRILDESQTARSL